MCPYADVFGRSRDLLSVGNHPPATSARPLGRPPVPPLSPVAPLATSVRSPGRPPAPPVRPGAPPGNYPLQMCPYADVFGRSRDLLAVGDHPPATSARPHGRPP